MILIIFWYQQFVTSMEESWVLNVLDQKVLSSRPEIINIVRNLPLWFTYWKINYANIKRHENILDVKEKRKKKKKVKYIFCIQPLKIILWECDHRLESSVNLYGLIWCLVYPFYIANYRDDIIDGYKVLHNITNNRMIQKYHLWPHRSKKQKIYLMMRIRVNLAKSYYFIKF